MTYCIYDRSPKQGKAVKDIPGYEGRYAVTEDGRVWSYSKLHSPQGRWLVPCVVSSGYHAHVLRGKQQELLHRIVALTYLPNPMGKSQVNHKNGNKQDNRVENLEWATPLENNQHANRTGLHAGHGLKQVLCVETGQMFVSARAASAWVNHNPGDVSRAIKRDQCCGGFHWRYV